MAARATAPGVLAVLALLAGCASVPGRSTTLVDGRWLDVATAGQGGPVVVFEGGLGADLTAWAQVLPEVAKRTRVFASSRPGYGASEPSASSRTGTVVVEELRAALRKQGLAPPYVLVGHSLGGLYLQLFARLHPDEVAGLLLIDSSHPAQMRGARGRPPVNLGNTLVRLYMTGTRGRELAALDDTGEAVLRAPALEGVPVTVINAGVDPRTLGRPLTPHEALRVDLFRLYPGCSERWVDSTHDVPRRRPEVVVQAVLELVEEARRRQAP